MSSPESTFSSLPEAERARLADAEASVAQSSALKTQLHAAKKRAHEHEDEILKAKEQKISAERSLLEMEEQLLAARKKSNAKEKEVELLRAQLDETQQVEKNPTPNKLKERIEELICENREIWLEKEKSNATIKKLNSWNETLKEDQIDLRVKHNALTSNHNALTSNHDALTASHNALTASHNSLTANHKRLKTNIISVRQELDFSATRFSDLSHKLGMDAPYADELGDDEMEGPSWDRLDTERERLAPVVEEAAFTEIDGTGLKVSDPEALGRRSKSATPAPPRITEADSLPPSLEDTRGGTGQHSPKQSDDMLKPQDAKPAHSIEETSIQVAEPKPSTQRKKSKKTKKAKESSLPSAKPPPAPEPIMHGYNSDATSIYSSGNKERDPLLQDENLARNLDKPKDAPLLGEGWNKVGSTTGRASGESTTQKSAGPPSSQKAPPLFTAPPRRSRKPLFSSPPSRAKKPAPNATEPEVSSSKASFAEVGKSATRGTQASPNTPESTSTMTLAGLMAEGQGLPRLGEEVPETKTSAPAVYKGFYEGWD